MSDALAALAELTKAVRARYPGVYRPRRPQRDAGPCQRLTLAAVAARCRREPNGCLLWRGSTTNSGFAQVRHGGTTVLVHRLVWTLAHGDLPCDAIVRRRCRDLRCVEAGHLYLSSHEERGRDAWAARRGRRPLPE